MQGLQGLLTYEQKNARVKALNAGMKRSKVIASFNLTDEQKTKVEAVGKEQRTVVRALQASPRRKVGRNHVAG
jgi:hypothetical protein